MRTPQPRVSFQTPGKPQAINLNPELSRAIQDAANCSFVRFNDTSLRAGVVGNLQAIDKEIAGRKQDLTYAVSAEEMTIINSLKIYYDSEGIKALATKLRWQLLGDAFLKGFITKFVKVKLGLHDPSADDKEQLELLAPYINLTFQTPKSFEFKEGGGVTRIADSFPSLACLNHLPDFEKTTSHHFQYYRWQDTRQIDRKKISELFELFKSNNRLLLRTAISERKSCCFLQPSAFLRALHYGRGGGENQQALVKRMWNASVIEAMQEYENDSGRVIPTPTFVIGDEFPSLLDSGLGSEIYQIANYDISKLDRELRSRSLSNGIMNPLMANHSSMIGNGAMGSGAASAAEEYFVRTHPSSFALKLATESVDIKRWVANAQDISRVPAGVRAASIANARAPVAAPARRMPFSAAPRKILPTAVRDILFGMDETYAYFSNFGDFRQGDVRRNFVKEIVKAEDVTGRNKSHFDWWVFPVNSSSNRHDWKYAVGNKEIDQLLANQNFMTKYQVMINTYFSEMGWDIHNNKKIDDRNFLTQEEINPTRLAKCLHSMKIFGLVDQHNSAVSFMEQSGLRPEGWGLHNYRKSHREAARQVGRGGRYEWCAGEFVDGFMIFRNNEQLYRHIDDRRAVPIRGAVGAIPQRRATVVAAPADAVEEDFHSLRGIIDRQEITLYPNRHIAPNTSVVASLYHSVVGRGYWAGNDRAGNFRAIDGVYSDEEDIKNTFIAAVICAARECGINKFSEIIATINKAKQYGGLSNIPADVEDAQDITQNRKNLSAIYQDICQQVGLLTGRKTEELKKIDGNSVAVGSRLTFFLDSGIDRLRELQGLHHDDTMIVQEGLGNLIRDKIARVNSGVIRASRGH